ncbi:MAG TPA: alpha/beta hydrolase [Beutenbergiaceae bacterium]|nr:alpha/beta hydrolase [Beutenbergiaceae bacterium]
MQTLSPRMLTLTDHEVAYVDSDPDATGNTPLVLLHGGAVNHRMWGPQLAAFSQRRLLAPDARGHGASSDATAPYRLCDDVVGLLDALGIGQAVLVGISMGGGTAVDVALEHPDRVAGLVVGGTGSSEPEFTEPWTLETFAAWARAEENADAEAWIEVFMRFVPGPRRTVDDVEPGVMDLIESMARETLTHVSIDAAGVVRPPVRPIPVRRTWERLPDLAVPVLAVGGAFDGQDNKAMGRRLAASAPGGQYLEFPRAGHYPNLECPAEFNAEVQRFLADHRL